MISHRSFLIVIKEIKSEIGARVSHRVFVDVPNSVLSGCCGKTPAPSKLLFSQLWLLAFKLSLVHAFVIYIFIFVWLHELLLRVRVSGLLWIGEEVSADVFWGVSFQKHMKDWNRNSYWKCHCHHRSLMVGNYFFDNLLMVAALSIYNAALLKNSHFLIFNSRTYSKAYKWNKC